MRGGVRTRLGWMVVAATKFALPYPALAGPPYVSDDPQPTDYRHFEIYAFTAGTAARGDVGGASGIDFNYGAAPDLQLTATLPIGFDRPTGGKNSFGLSNIELAAKYRFLHQDSFGLDVSIFPRIFLPSGSNVVGNSAPALLLPVWVQKDWAGGWSAFGGGCGVGLRYDINETYHLLGYIRRGIESAGEADQVSWYASVLFTF